jgi:death-on-curing protein
VKPGEGSDLLAEVRGLLEARVDWDASDLETTLSKVRLLTTAAAYLNGRLLEIYGGHRGEGRGLDLVEQIVGAAFQGFAGKDAHPDDFEKAAMLFRGITQGHPFGDGNKRTGLAMAAYYLELAGFQRPTQSWDADKVYGFCVAVSSGEIRDIGVISSELRVLWGYEGGPATR